MRLGCIVSSWRICPCLSKLITATSSTPTIKIRRKLSLELSYHSLHNSRRKKFNSNHVTTLCCSFAYSSYQICILFLHEARPQYLFCLSYLLTTPYSLHSSIPSRTVTTLRTHLRVYSLSITAKENFTLVSLVNTILGIRSAQERKVTTMSQRNRENHA